MTNEQIAEKAAEEINDEFTAVQCIYVGVPRTCKYMSHADFNHRAKELKEASQGANRIILAAINEATAKEEALSDRFAQEIKRQATIIKSYKEATAQKDKEIERLKNEWTEAGGFFQAMAKAIAKKKEDK